MGVTQPRATTVTYYPAIDGLRAIAVLAVIINHFDEALLPSGFLGVDIFFVISGFVITASLTNRQHATAAEFFQGFYKRRIKRLLPALAVCVAVTGTAISLFNPDPRAALRTGVAALFGVSNIDLFLSATDYWGEAADLNPFTHTWSLGVEEQFYLLFPLLLWFLLLRQPSAHAHRTLRRMLIVVGALSLIAFAAWTGINQAAAYYLSPFRFWELAAGCLVFLHTEQPESTVRRALQHLHPGLPVIAIIAVLFAPAGQLTATTVSAVALTALLLLNLQSRPSSVLSLHRTPAASGPMVYRPLAGAGAGVTAGVVHDADDGCLRIPPG